MNTSLIYKYCSVKEHTHLFGVEVIWYFEDGFGTLETYDPLDKCHEMFSCNSKEEYDLIVSMI